MNVLLVTPNTQDARLIENELAKRIAGLHVDIAAEVEQAVARLASPGNFSAVLLDATLPYGDPVAVIRAARAENGPIAVIGLVADADIDFGLKLVESGADDFVTKGTGFAQRLAEVIRLACASAPKVLYASGNADAVGAHTRTSLRPDTAGATRVLIRNNQSEADRTHATQFSAALMERLHRAESLSRQMEEEVQAAEYWSLERELLELERRQQSIEEKRLPLQEAVLPDGATTEEQRGFLQKDMKQLQSDSESVNHLEAVEEQHLEQEREKEASQRHVGEQQKEAPAERGFAPMLEAAAKEKERLLNLVRRLEIQVVSKAEELRREREQWDLFRIALNRKLASIESRHAALEHVVVEERQRQRKLAEQHSAEMSQSENARLELETRYQVAAADKAKLQDSLRAAEVRIADSNEQRRAEIEKTQSACLVMEQQNRELQETIAKLQEANRGLSRERDELLAQLEMVRLEHENQANVLAGKLSQILEKHNHAVEKYRSELAELAPLADSLEEEIKLARQNPERSAGSKRAG